MRRLNVLRSVVLFITLGLLLGTAVSAGAAPPAPAIPDPAVSAGAFDRLSPGNQKIARALFESQSRTTLPPGTRPLTLDQMAAMKQKTGWGVVFKEMYGDVVQNERLFDPARQTNLLTDALDQFFSQFDVHDRPSTRTPVGRWPAY